MVLRRSLQTIQVEENSFQVPRYFKTEERSKKGTKTEKITQEILAHAPLRMNHMLMRMRQPWLLTHAPLCVHPCARAWLAA